MNRLWNLFIKNKYGQMRSGWIILLVMALYYGIMFLVTNSFMDALRDHFILTGDIIPETGYLSPLIDRINSVVLPQVMQLLTDIFMIAIPVISWKLIQRHKIAQLGLISLSAGKKDCLAGMALGFLCCTIVFLLIIAVGDVQVDWTPHFSINTFIWILLFVIVALGEEILNRGFFMANLRRSRNLFFILIVPSVIFGLIHLSNPGVTLLSVINIIIVGIMFSYMFLKSGNIWMCVGYHFTWNTFQGAIYGMPVSGLDIPGIITTRFSNDNLLNGGLFGIEGGILTTLVTLLGLAFVWYYYRDSKYDFIRDTSDPA